MGFSLDLRYHICLQPMDLPVFNPIALELLQLLTNHYIDMDHIIATINKDQSLAIQVLRMANSSAYAGLVKSQTIKDSVNRLGAEQITNMAMAASQAALHTSVIPVVNDVMKDLYLHSYACAIGCHSVAINTDQRELADQAYLAGLLHDIGKIYLLKAMEQISLNDETKFELDRETLLDVFSDMHVEQGVRIMDHWGIPPLYQAIVTNHHSDHFDPNDKLLAIARLVNFKSTECKMNIYPQFIQPHDTMAEISALNVSEEVLSQLLEDMRSSCA